jgi:predicted CopG family antitoxin
VQNTDLSDEIDQKKTVIESFSQVEREFRRTQKKIEIFKAYAATQNSEEVFDRVVSRMPSEVSLNSMTLTKGEVVVTAQGASEQIIAQFIANLRDETIFSNISLIASESSSDDPNVRFQLKMTVSLTES